MMRRVAGQLASAMFILAAALFLLASAADAARTVTWDDLAPPWDDTRNPVTKMTSEQQNDVYTLFYGPSYDNPGATRNEEEQQAYDRLKAAGIDPEGLFKTIEDLRKEAEARDNVLLPELDKQQIRLSGYVLPVDFDGDKVKSFLLVAFVGACIHVPPPPPNQIVYVEADEPFESAELFTPVWVTGEVSVGMDKTSLSLVDGTNDIDFGYRMKATKIEPYEEGETVDGG